ncbi:conserved protein of unknown function [Bartonella clarridgeiae 73]|uniref:Uncharacterized protein n=1 Tax=Bartonella clarridgeiae (strain CCUG 45776 / CIP 104772 / 73) TaxID=696125 RepID=E6YJ04_BARC7|nr:hypothetical protein [Bartonella clarridgeiae]WCR55930.1 MAG: hypothetical protein PG977_001323 [Bartonella clarridgeiae]CBI76842.1 conserved protein of unknown function [Bartonella clarridgeiae 73]
MALFPFSIADIDDPNYIRVVLYASGRMGHAPLNALLKKIHQEVRRENKKHQTNYTNLLQRVTALEEKLTTIIKDNSLSSEKAG